MLHATPVQSPVMTASHVALYPGSFDPITLGHLDVLSRARRMFDSIVVGVGQNPEKAALFNAEERVAVAQHLVDELLSFEPQGCPVRVEPYAGLTVDFAKSLDAVAIIRGIRNVSDVAAECQLAITNRQVADIETVFIVTGERFAYTSSSLIKQVAALGGSLDRLRSIVPPIVLEKLREKLNDPHNPIGRLARDQNTD